MGKGYIVVTYRKISSQDKWAAYAKLAAPAVQKAGGRFIVRGGPIEVLDGDWAPQRVVVISFPDLVRARAWRSSPDYRRACEIRDRAAKTKMILVEGVE